MWQKNPNKKIVKLDVAGLRKKSIELLARREYSLHEIESKLFDRAENQSHVDEVLEWLTSNNLQNDQRFTEMFLRSKALSGYGPVRIKLELKQKGILEMLIDDVFEQQDISWAEEINRLCERKLMNVDKSDFKSRQKVMAFLQRRGFYLEQIRDSINLFYTDQDC